MAQVSQAEIARERSFLVNSQGSRHMKILIETIPHSEQRYPTVGDWQWTQVKVLGRSGFPADDKLVPTLHIKVSEMSDWRHEALVAIHEAVEALLCKYAGITEQEVDDFDKVFEAKKPCNPDGRPFSLMQLQQLSPRELEDLKLKLSAEPGDSPTAPYYHEHKVARAIESRLAGELKVDWDKYEGEVNSL